jgi:hypothetical protein
MKSISDAMKTIANRASIVIVMRVSSMDVSTSEHVGGQVILEGGTRPGNERGGQFMMFRNGR